MNSSYEISIAILASMLFTATISLYICTLFAQQNKAIKHWFYAFSLIGIGFVGFYISVLVNNYAASILCEFIQIFGIILLFSGYLQAIQKPFPYAILGGYFSLYIIIWLLLPEGHVYKSFHRNLFVSSSVLFTNLVLILGYFKSLKTLPGTIGLHLQITIIFGLLIGISRLLIYLIYGNAESADFRIVSSVYMYAGFMYFILLIFVFAHYTRHVSKLEGFVYNKKGDQ